MCKYQFLSPKSHYLLTCTSVLIADKIYIQNFSFHSSLGNYQSTSKSSVTLISTPPCVLRAFKDMYQLLEQLVWFQIQSSTLLEWQFYFYYTLINHCHFLLPLCGRYAFVLVAGSVNNVSDQRYTPSLKSCFSSGGGFFWVLSEDVYSQNSSIRISSSTGKLFFSSDFCFSLFLSAYSL